MEQTKVRTYHQTILKLASSLANTRTIVIICLCYLILSFSLPIKRDFLVWQAINDTTLAYVFALFFGFTLYSFGVLILGNGFPKIAKVLNQICSKKVIYPICFGTLGLTLVLTALHIPGFWWTWTSLGAQVCTVLLTYLILEKKTQPYEAIIAGLGLSGIAIGIWEIPYQWGMGFIYYPKWLPPEALSAHIIYQTLIELPLIIMGILILIVLNRKYKIVSFSKWFWIFLAVTTGLYICWFLTGFQQEVVYNWDSQQWVQTPMNMIVKTIYRASKVTLALGLISLMWKGKNEISRR